MANTFFNLQTWKLNDNTDQFGMGGLTLNGVGVETYWPNTKSQINVSGASNQTLLTIATDLTLEWEAINNQPYLSNGSANAYVLNYVCEFPGLNRVTSTNLSLAAGNAAYFGNQSNSFDNALNMSNNQNFISYGITITDGSNTYYIRPFMLAYSDSNVIGEFLLDIK